MNIKVPCTSANLGVLFDKGGVALDAFFNEINIEKASFTSIRIEGLGASTLPQDKSNLVCTAISRYYEIVGRPEPQYRLNMHNQIPLSRGLGSSAACIAGGIYAANILEGNLLAIEDLIHMAAEVEGHGDNVCPAILGGITLYKKNSIKSFEYSSELAFILYIPENELSTKKSRAVLPVSYQKETLETAARLEREMIDSLSKKDYAKAGSLMELDVIHQPYRKELIPFWDDVIDAARRAGAYGTALSGAGPSMISMCLASEKETILKKVHNAIDITHGLNIIGCEIFEKGLITEYGGDRE